MVYNKYYYEIDVVYSILIIIIIVLNMLILNVLKMAAQNDCVKFFKLLMDILIVLWCNLVNADFINVAQMLLL